MFKKIAGHKQAILLILSSFISVFSFSQTLDKIGTKEMFKVSGGLGYNMNFMDSYGGIAVPQPFNWGLTGNVNLSILDVSLPFSISFNNRGKSYTQPTNFVAVHPSYKKFKSHIGNISMTFSPYTFSGLMVAGAGVEYATGAWKFQTIGGRFKKRIEYSSEINNTQTMGYGRYGGAFLVGFDKKGYSIQLIAMKAKDNARTLLQTPSTATVNPMDNIATAVKVKATLIKSLTLDGEISNSIVARNTFLDPTVNETFWKKAQSRLVQTNGGTDVYTALNTSLNYKFKVFGIGAKYERIDPGYTSLGGQFFNNDMENWTLTPSANLLKGKLNVNGSFGLQRNNLENTVASASKRWVGNVSISSQPIKNLSISANYSNFSSFSKRNPAADPFYTILADTLNMYQISSSVSGNASYSFGKKAKQSTNISINRSVSQNITGRLQDAAAFGYQVEDGISSAPNISTSGVWSHSFQFSKSKISLGYTVNANFVESINSKSQQFGPGMQLAIPLKKPKMNLSFGATYNQSYSNEVLNSHVMNVRFGTGYSPELWDKKYGACSMNLSAGFVERFSTDKTKSNQGNLNVLFGVNYSF